MDKASENSLEWGKIGLALVMWGIIGMVIGMYFNGIDKQFTQKVTPLDAATAINRAEVSNTSNSVLPYQIAPLTIENPNTVVEIEVSATLPSNHWTFVEVEVLNQNNEYLFSFGQELWHETGSDSDGPWREQRESFNTRITFEYAGIYKLNFLADSKRKLNPKSLSVLFKKRRGSNIAHFWLGVLLCVTGLLIIEWKHQILTTLLSKGDDD